MIAAVLVVYILNCFFLIMVVLLQAGKGDGMAGVFGGGGSNTILGNRGAATFLSKLTVGSAVLFMLFSIILAYHSSDPGSVIDARPVAPDQSPVISGLQNDEEEEQESSPGTTDEEDDEATDETDDSTQQVAEGTGEAVVDETDGTGQPVEEGSGEPSRGELVEETPETEGESPVDDSSGESEVESGTDEVVDEPIEDDSSDENIEAPEEPETPEETSEPTDNE